MSPMNPSTGNMYPWVTHTHCHHRGRCPHGCTYCYSIRGRGKAHYEGPLRLVEKELLVNYGDGKTIFIEHMIDLFANGVDDMNIARVLGHCTEYPGNTYVIQTRNLTRLNRPYWRTAMPKRVKIGTTIETNREELVSRFSKAPPVNERAAMLGVLGTDYDTFLTIEPVMDFDVEALTDLVAMAWPDWVNIGADSKRTDLPEPSWEKILELVKALADLGIRVDEKSNLERLKVKP